MADCKTSHMNKAIMEMYLRHLYGPKLQPITMTLEEGRRHMLSARPDALSYTATDRFKLARRGTLFKSPAGFGQW